MLLAFISFLLFGVPMVAVAAALVLLKLPYFSEVRVVVPWFLFPSLGLSSGCWNLLLFLMLARRAVGGPVALLAPVSTGIAIGVIAAALNFRRFA